MELHSNELLTFGPVFSFFQLRKQQRHSWGLVAATLEKLEVSLSLTAVVFFQTAAVEERIRERERREKKKSQAQFQATHRICNKIHDLAYNRVCSYCFCDKPITRLSVSLQLDVSSVRCLFM